MRRSVPVRRPRAQAWDTLGREGRTFVAGGPSARQISEVTGAAALTPIRVYAGRTSADSVDGIAEHVIAELHRTHAFERKVLAVVTTTGRGWVNPNVASAFETLNGGNTRSHRCSIRSCPARCPSSPTGRLRRWRDRRCSKRCTGFGLPCRKAATETRGVRGESGFVRRTVRIRLGADSSAAPTVRCWWVRPISRAVDRITANRDPGSFERLPIVDEGRHIRFASRPHDELTGAWEFPGLCSGSTAVSHHLVVVRSAPAPSGLVAGTTRARCGPRDAVAAERHLLAGDAGHDLLRRRALRVRARTDRMRLNCGWRSWRPRAGTPP